MGSAVEDVSLSLEKTQIHSSDRLIEWDMTADVGIVPNPRGTIWSTVGQMRDSKMTVTLEETLFLAEFHKYKIFFNNTETSVVSFMSNFPESKIRDYEIYRDLRKFGYIALPFNSRYFASNRLFDDSRAEYSVFKPNSGFKKSEPTGFIGHFSLIEQTDSLTDVIDRQIKFDKSTFWCLHDGGSNVTYLEAAIVTPKPSGNSK